MVEPERLIVVRQRPEFRAAKWNELPDEDLLVLYRQQLHQLADFGLNAVGPPPFVQTWSR